MTITFHRPHPASLEEWHGRPDTNGRICPRHRIPFEYKFILSDDGTEVDVAVPVCPKCEADARNA